ncbi:MAG: hypothetical protein QNK20_16690 [Aureibaculum sp.]|nr:hypothetical protein [Aureibaculum sp.]
MKKVNLTSLIILHMDGHLLDNVNTFELIIGDNTVLVTYDYYEQPETVTRNPDGSPHTIEGSSSIQILSSSVIDESGKVMNQYDIHDEEIRQAFTN